MDPAAAKAGADPAMVSRLLLQWREGDPSALEALVPLVYDELRRLARLSMRGENADLTLQPTALVAEAYLRLVEADVAWNGRVHFYAVASNLMRRILVDEARRRQAKKRGGAERPLSIEELASGGCEIAADPEATPLLELDAALARLEELDPRKAKVVELRCFVGLTIEDAALVLGCSTATVERDLRMAKAWLTKEIRATAR